MKRTNKGFTLAELLIVVAIIAVLVAVAIPAFNGQLEKSRQSTDLSNLRDAYAAAKLAEIQGETPAVDASGEAVKPTRIGHPAQWNNMSDEEKAAYSGIGYAFIYDPDASILYPINSETSYTAEEDATAQTFAPTVELTDLDAFVKTKLKARSTEIRIETANLPGGGTTTVEYGFPAAVDNDGTPTGNFAAGATKRLWGDSAPDYNNARIIVEFSFDAKNSMWKLARVNVDQYGESTTSTDINLAPIRFQTFGNVTSGDAVCPTFTPHEEANFTP